MKDRLNLIASVVGIIGFVGTLASWFFGSSVALVVSLILLALAIFIAILQRKRTKIAVEKILDTDIWVSASRRNRLCIDSSFLARDGGTLLFWLLVPRKGEGLRQAPDNRYVFSHHTGEDDGSAYPNAFFLRYSSDSTWDFCISNPDGEMPNDLGNYCLADGLSPDWHHFHITWDHSIPRLQLLIDSGKSISFTSRTYLPYWPREFASCVYFGAWTTDYPESYVETKFRKIWVCDKHLGFRQPIVVDHSSLKV
jgi:hypothetical protein